MPKRHETQYHYKAAVQVKTAPRQGNSEVFLSFSKSQLVLPLDLPISKECGTSRLEKNNLGKGLSLNTKQVKVQIEDQ